MLGNNKAGYPKTLYDDDVAPGAYRIKGLVSWSTLIPTTIQHYNEQMQLLTAWDRQYLVMDELAYVAPDASFALKATTLNELKIDTLQSIVNTVNAKTKDEARAERESMWNSFVTSYRRQGDTYIEEINTKASQLGL